MILTKRWFDIPPNVQSHAVQKQLWSDVWNNRYKYYIVVAARRTFKSERTKRYVVIRAMSEENLDIYMLAPTFAQAKRLFWRDLEDFIPKKYIKKIHTADAFIELKNGSRVNILGAEAHRRIQGVRADIIYISEAQLVDRDVFTESIFPIIVDNANAVLIAEGRPLTKSSMFYELFQRGNNNKEPDIKSYHWTAESILTEEQLREAKRSLDEESYKREFMASFETTTANPYYALSENNYLQHHIDTNYPILLSWDFNATEKPMSVVIAQQIIHNDREILYVHKAVQLKYTNTSQMADVAIKYLDSLKGEPRIRMYGDYSGNAHHSNSSLTDWQILETKFKKYLMPFNPIQTFPAKSVRNMTGTVNRLLRNALGETTLYINPREARALIEDMTLTEWDKNGIRFNEHNPERTHLCDAINYICEAIYGNRGSKIMLL